MNYTNKDVLAIEQVEIINYLPEIGIDNVQDEIILGLKSTPKRISSKFFYDDIGSELFERITELDEYYPTRTEKKILSTLMSNLNIEFSNINIIELGSGDHSKISLLLQQIPQNLLSTINYFPVDISQSAIEQSIEKLTSEFPMLNTKGIVADFIHQLNVIPVVDKRLFCFFGSTIGNLNMAEIEGFMKNLGEEMQPGDNLLLGMDMIKEAEVLERAYNDDLQATAKFNKNILNVINGLIGSDFNTNEFKHIAFYNRVDNRIEMHLEAIKDINVKIGVVGDIINIKKGETIHTENSHKFDKDIINKMGTWAGIETEKIFSDTNQWFSLVHFSKQ